MPTPTALLCRLIWIAALVIALIAAAEGNSRYRWWSRYLAASLLFAPFFWPEIQGWTDDNWGWLIALNLLRITAAGEAFYFQARDFRWWWRLCGAVVLMAVFFVELIWQPLPASNRDIALRMMRYGQIWVGAAVLVQGMIFWKLGAWRPRAEDLHFSIISLICISHAAVSIAMLASPATWQVWRWLDPTATLVDSLAVLACALLCSAHLPEHRAYGPDLPLSRLAD